MGSDVEQEIRGGKFTIDLREIIDEFAKENSIVVAGDFHTGLPVIGGIPEADMKKLAAGVAEAVGNTIIGRIPPMFKMSDNRREVSVRHITFVFSELQMFEFTKKVIDVYIEKLKIAESLFFAGPEKITDDLIQ